MSSAIVQAAIPAAAALGAAGFQAWSARQTNQQNIDFARENREWQKEQADTAVQRRVADLKSAGLSPMLALGSQAAQPSSQAPQVQGELGAAVNSALELYRTAAQIDNVNAQTAQIERKTAGDFKGRAAQMVDAVIPAILKKTMQSASNSAKTAGSFLGHLGKDRMDQMRKWQVD